MTKSSERVPSKECLLNAAEKLFSAEGYAAVSTRDIAEAANVNLGAIQYHFGSKANLFVATLRRMLEGGPCAKAGLEVVCPGKCRISAARHIAKFIRGYLCYLLHSVGPQPYRIMYREILSESSQDSDMREALVETVSRDFLQPLEQSLTTAIRHVDPCLSVAAAQMSAQSIVGQCSHYAAQRPFLEKLRETDLGNEKQFDELARHITQFSLRGLGLTDEEILEAIAFAISSNDPASKPTGRLPLSDQSKEAP